MAAKKTSTSTDRSKSAKKGHQTRRENKQIVAAESRRQEFESAHPERFQDIFDMTGTSRDSMSHSAAMSAMGFRDDAPHPQGQMELPGMENVDRARQTGLLPQRSQHDPRNTLPDTTSMGYSTKSMASRAQPSQPHQARWEDLHPDDQAAVLRTASMYGVTEQSAFQGYSTQLQQAHMRARQMGYSEPTGMRFYSGHDDPEVMNPRKEIQEAAERQGVHRQTMATAVALTSPRMQFSDYEKRDYPNISGAEEYVRRGMNNESLPGSPIMRKNVTTVDGRPAKIAMLPDRGEIAGLTAPQSESGTLERDLSVGKMNQKSKTRDPNTLQSVMGEQSQEKITAFSGALKDPHGSGSMFVSDTHSAQSFAPHLGKDELAEYAAKPGIKLFHDYVARKVHAHLGLSSTHSNQASQWAEQQIQAGEADPDALYHAAAAGDRPVSRQFSPLPR